LLVLLLLLLVEGCWVSICICIQQHLCGGDDHILLPILAAEGHVASDQQHGWQLPLLCAITAAAAAAAQGHPLCQQQLLLLARRGRWCALQECPRGAQQVIQV
jgi:hypothetical protein